MQKTSSKIWTQVTISNDDNHYITSAAISGIDVSYRWSLYSSYNEKNKSLTMHAKSFAFAQITCNEKVDEQQVPEAKKIFYFERCSQKIQLNNFEMLLTYRIIKFEKSTYT